MKSKKELSRIESSTFIFDLRSILSDSPSAFSAPKISAATLDRLDYLSNLTNGAVAIISDWEITKIRKLTKHVADNLTLIGSHGGEIQERQSDYLSSEPSVSIDLARQEINDFVSQLKPAYVENKKLSVVVHYGPAPELSGTIYKKLSNIAKSIGNEFQVVEGFYCWELKAAIHNKGAALSRLLRTPNFAKKTPYIFGTDQSAETVFLVAKLKDGYGIKVGQQRRNTRAQYHLENSAALEDWIRRLCIIQSIPEFKKEATPSKSIAA